MFTSELLEIFQIIRANYGEVRVIGGAVRDTLLAKEIDDIDLATNLIPDKIIQIFSKTNFTIIPLGKEFGTVIIKSESGKEYQITTLRKDVSTDGRHAKVEFCTSWEDDATRRDFTINAMSMDLDGKIYDYFHGREDLENRLVRFIGSAKDRIIEDHLRILRYYRFVAKIGSVPDEETRAICKDNILLLKKLSAQRIYDELNKIFALDNWQNTFNYLLEDLVLSTILECKLDVNYFNNIYLPEQKIDSLLEIIICLLVKKNYSNNIDSLKNIFTSKNSLDLCLALLNCDYHILLKEEKYDEFFYYTNKYFIQFLVYCSALLGVDKGKIEDIYQKFRNKTLPIFPVTGKDLLLIGYKSGIDIGNKLKELEKIWINDNFKVSRDYLLEVAKRENDRAN